MNRPQTKTPLEHFTTVRSRPTPTVVVDVVSSERKAETPKLKMDTLVASAPASKGRPKWSAMPKPSASAIEVAYRSLHGCTIPEDARAFWAWMFGRSIRLDVALVKLKEASKGVPRFSTRRKGEIEARKLKLSNRLGPLGALSVAYAKCTGMQPTALFSICCLKECLGQNTTVYSVARAVESYCQDLAGVGQGAIFHGWLLRARARLTLRKRFGDGDILADISALETKLELIELQEAVRRVSYVVAGNINRQN
jgi:hypothetical protein